MILRIEESDNDDFCVNGEPNEDRLREVVARMIREVADKIESGNDCGAIFDANGNKVGSYLL